MSVNNDLIYLLRMLESIGKIQLYRAEIDDPIEFFETNDQQAFNASLSLLVHIGEQSGKISEELKEIHPILPWQQIKNFRNRVAHNYIGIDRFITFDIILNELPKFQDKIQRIIQTELNTGIFDITEYELAKQSEYYRHIDYQKID